MAGPTTLFQTGDHASRPAASAGCVFYWCTTHDIVYRADGSAWATLMDLSALSGSGIAETLLDAKGDLIAASAADTAAKLTVGANNTTLLAASGETTGLKWGHPVLTASEALASGNTTTAADTIIDVAGVTLSLAAGTWVLSGGATVDTGTAVYFLVALTDGSNVEYSVARGQRNTGTPLTLPVIPRVVTIGSTTTFKLRAQTGAAGSILRYGTGTTPGSSLVALRVA